MIILMKLENIKSKRILSLKILVVLLEVLALALVLYLILLPFYPLIKYNVSYKNEEIVEEAKSEEAVIAKTAEIKSHLPQSNYDVSANRVIITKIGVNAPVVEANNAEYGLSQGAWRIPETSTPDKGGNTVITGHRFKYLPPHNMTFYLFHKIEEGDIVSAIWDEKDYYYRVKEIKIVEPSDLSVLDPTEKPTLTMFTCHPIYSTDKRLVVISELIESDEAEKELFEEI